MKTIPQSISFSYISRYCLNAFHPYNSDPIPVLAFLQVKFKITVKPYSNNIKEIPPP